MSRSSVTQLQRPSHAGVSLAEIVSSSGWGSILCSVYNYSEHGAMLAIPVDYKFPKTFSLRRVATINARAARLVWQNYGLAGIEFIDIAGIPGFAPD